MIALTSLEVYNFMININSTNSKFELLTDTFDEFSLEDVRDELEEILNLSDITPSHLQLEKIGPRIIEACRKKTWKNQAPMVILFY